MKKSYAFNFLALILLLSGCGSPTAGGGKGVRFPRTGNSPNDQIEIEEAELSGSYVATLKAINGTVAGPISGNVNLTRKDSDILAYVRFSGGGANTVHMQRVHIGSSCPSMAQDANADGFLDGQEAYAHTGGAIIPLDADLSSQDRGSSIWPVGDQYGNYWYEENAPYDRLLEDLYDVDMDGQDDYIKLSGEKKLHFDSYIVMIYGIAPETVLPGSVSGRGRLSKHQILPVACGVLKKITTLPGTVEDDSDSGLEPGEGDISGGNGHVDDGASFPRGESTPEPNPEVEDNEVRTTDNYGDED